MGKPRYHNNQILKDKNTGEMYFIKNISYSKKDFFMVFIMYTICKLNLFGKKMTPNEQVRH